jgi:hypothetical protein
MESEWGWVTVKHEVPVHLLWIFSGARVSHIPPKPHFSRTCSHNMLVFTPVILQTTPLYDLIKVNSSQIQFLNEVQQSTSAVKESNTKGGWVDTASWGWGFQTDTPEPVCFWSVGKMLTWSSDRQEQARGARTVKYLRGTQQRCSQLHWSDVSWALLCDSSVFVRVARWLWTVEKSKRRQMLSCWDEAGTLISRLE